MALHNSSKVLRRKGALANRKRHTKTKHELEATADAQSLRDDGVGGRGHR